jgi:hypothetical protein
MGHIRGLVKTVLGDLGVISCLYLICTFFGRARLGLYSAQRPFCFCSFSQFSRQLVMLNTFAYAYEFWLVDFMTRRKLDVHFTQTGQRVLKRQGYTYHKSVFHAFLHLHFGIYHQNTRD